MASRFASRARKWQAADSRDVSGGLTDEKIWRELALGLVINRSVPDYIDDDTVSRELWRVWATYWLPWQISDEEMESMCHAAKSD
jgi:hypothetical protein